MSGQSAVTDAHLADLGEGGLEGGQQLALELGVDLAALVFGADVAAHVAVEGGGVHDLVAVFTEAADGDVDIQVGIAVHHAEGHGRRRAILVADDLLGVEIVDPLILRSVAAEGETLEHGAQNVLQALAQVAAEDAGLRGHIVDEFAGLGAEIDDLALLDDHHALTVGNGDHAAIGDDVIRPLGIAGTTGDPLRRFDSQGIGRNRFTIEVFFPLISQHTAGSAQSSTNKSHEDYLQIIEFWLKLLFIHVIL